MNKPCCVYHGAGGKSSHCSPYTPHGKGRKCVACGGKGKTGSGETCGACNGSGRVFPETKRKHGGKAPAPLAGIEDPGGYVLEVTSRPVSLHAGEEIVNLNETLAYVDKLPEVAPGIREHADREREILNRLRNLLHGLANVRDRAEQDVSSRWTAEEIAQAKRDASA